MGIFESFATYSNFDSDGYINEAELEEEMDRLEEMEPADLPDDLMEACIETALANEKNFNTLMMTIAHEEMSYFIENGVEMIYEEGKVSNFFKRIKDIIDLAWKKIKALFDKVVSKISEWVTSDKAFCKKYKDAIMKYGSKVEVDNVYNTIGKSSDGMYTTISNKLTTKINDVFDNRSNYKDTSASDIIGQIKAEVVGKSGKLDSGDFKKALKAYFRMDDKVTVGSDGTTIFNELAAGKTTQKLVKASYNTAKSSIANLKKTLQATEKKANTVAKSNGSDSTSGFGIVASLCSAGVSMLNEAQQVQISAISNTHTVCRKLAVKCVQEAKKNKDAGSSDDTTNAADESYVDNAFASMLV